MSAVGGQHDAEDTSDSQERDADGQDAEQDEQDQASLQPGEDGYGEGERKPWDRGDHTQRIRDRKAKEARRQQGRATLLRCVS